MIKLTVSYSSLKEKDRLLEAIRKQFNIVDIKKDYEGNGKYLRRLYVNVEVQEWQVLK